jgi:hypothetical protein
MSAVGLHNTPLHQKSHSNCITVKVFHCNS